MEQTAREASRRSLALHGTHFACATGTAHGSLPVYRLKVPCETLAPMKNCVCIRFAQEASAHNTDAAMTEDELDGALFMCSLYSLGWCGLRWEVSKSERTKIKLDYQASHWHLLCLGDQHTQNTKYCPAQPRAMGCGLFWGLTPVATHAHADAPDHRSRSHLREPIFTKPSNGPGLLRHLIAPRPRVLLIPRGRV